VFQGKFEIVSLTGTFSQETHHVHMSISDSKCAVFGGHVMEGCIVRTTAEIAIGDISGINFERRDDSRTGYDELYIAESAQPVKKMHTCTTNEVEMGAGNSHKLLAAKGQTKTTQKGAGVKVQETTIDQGITPARMGMYMAIFMVAMGCAWEFFVTRKINPRN
jgi:hypothetical protein